MRRLVRVSVVVLILVAVGAASYRPLHDYWRNRNRPRFRTAEVTRGTIRSVVNATGKVQPKLSVHVGSFVSGPVKELYVDFNQDVKEGDLLAKIDPRIYEASVERDTATLRSQQAEVQRVEALLNQARRDEQRALALRAEDEDFVSDAELDRLCFNRQSLEAQLEIANAAVAQAQANLDNSQTNLRYTEILAPVSGRIIDRKVDPGQTLAAQFQVPELFVLAVDLGKEIYVHASVDEADMGLIIQAQRRGQPVEFRVQAYPDQLFTGTINQIRLSSTETQNVVTYPVIVSAPNPELKLLPGMTADLSFQIEKKENVLRVPNSALRFYPDPQHVRPEDRHILEGTRDASDEPVSDSAISAAERVSASVRRRQRHVWVEVTDGLLKAVQIQTGLVENQWAELVAGDLKEGQKVAIGIRPNS